MITIRRFEKTDADYEKAVSIVNAVWPEYPDTVDEWKEADERRAEKLRWERYFAALDGEPVAVGNYGQSLWMYHPRKFWVSVHVLPAYRRRGVGTALYEHILEELEQQYQPITLYAGTREDYRDGMRFLHRHGFEETLREWESRLDPSTVDLAEWAHYHERVARQGIEIRTVRELESDPDRDRKLHELEWQIDQDVPSFEPPTQVPFEEWQKVWERQNLIPEAWFVAVEDGEYVGMSNLWRTQADPHLLYTGLTGVVRSHRRQGIATALKLRAVHYAQENGITEVRTWNESNNQGMLGINTRLGFVRQPAHVEFVKKLRPEEDAESAEPAMATA